MPGETTPDKEFTLETVNCLGACALGPVCVVDGHYFSKVSPSKVQGIIEENEARTGKNTRHHRPESVPSDAELPPM